MAAAERPLKPLTILSFFKLYIPNGGLIMFKNRTQIISKMLPLAIITLLIITLIPTQIEAESYGSQPTALITFSSDDGYIGIYNNKDLFINRSIPLTTFVITGVVGDPDRVNYTQLSELSAAGWEIGSHTAGAASITTYNSTELFTQVVGSKSTLEGQGFNVYSFAYPNGETNNTCTNLIKQHYSCARDVTTVGYVAAGTADASITVSDFDGVAVTNNLPQMKSWVDMAIANDEWLNFYFHNITADGKFTSITTYYVYQLLDYVKEKVDAGQIRAVNFYEGYRSLMERSQIINARTIAINSQQSYFDCKEDVYLDPQLKITGLTLTNLLTNPSFEDFTTSFPGWNSGAGLLTKTRASGGYIGTYASDWKFNSASSSWARSIYQDVTVSPSTIVPGDYAFAYVYIKNIANVSKIGMTLEFYNAAGTMLSQQIESGQVITNSWVVYDNRLLSAWSLIPNDCAKVRWRIDVNEFTAGAADGTIRVDGAVLTKIDTDPAPVTYDKPPYILRPIVPFVGSINTTNLSVIIDGETYSYSGELAEGQTVVFDLPYDMYSGYHLFTPTIGGHGLAYIELVGTRTGTISYGQFGASTCGIYRVINNCVDTRMMIFEYNASITIDSPAAVNAFIPVAEDGRFYVYSGAEYAGPFASSNGFIYGQLNDGENTIVTESDYNAIQMANAISPIFAIIPLVIIVSVISMVMGLGKKLK